MPTNSLTLDRILHAILREASGKELDLAQIRDEYTNQVPEYARPHKRHLWRYVYSEMEKLRSKGLVSTSRRSFSSCGKAYSVTPDFGEQLIEENCEPFLSDTSHDLDQKRVDDLKYKIKVYWRTAFMLNGTLDETRALAREIPSLARELTYKETKIFNKILEVYGRIGALAEIIEDLLDSRQCP